MDSTRHVAALGDRARRDLLEQHHRVVRAALERFRGREIVTAGDGFLAVFDGPALARPSEVLVSSTVKDLVVGSGFSFDDRGRHELKGVPACGTCSR